jgi:hypothetical protein
MRRPATAFAPAALVVPACVLHLLPAWAVLVLVGAGMVLTAAQVIVTLIIRLRASSCITNSRDALRVLEIEDLLHERHHHRASSLPGRRNQQRSPASRRPGGPPPSGDAVEEATPG